MSTTHTPEGGSFFGRLGKGADLRRALNYCEDAGASIEQNWHAGTAIARTPVELDERTPAGSEILKAIRKAPGVWLIMYRKGVWPQ